MLVLLFVGVLIILFLIGMAIPYAIGITSAIVALFEKGLADFPYEMFAQRMVSGTNNFLLLVIPLFILAAKIMNVSTVTEKIFGFASTLVGWLPGGLGHANVVASIIFAGKSGSAVADASGLGTIEIEAMTKKGYDLEFTAAITAASSTIAPVIPPSIPLAMYGAVSGVSVGALFLGGIIPGLLMAVSLMVLVHIYAVKRKYPREKFPTLSEIWTGLKDSFLSLLTPVILIGGMISGLFTPTEASAIAVVYASILMVFYKKFSFKVMIQLLKETFLESSVILFIVAVSGIYGWLLARTQIPIIVAEAMLSISSDPLIIFLLINIFFLILGCFMETISAILIVTPVIMPVTAAVGIDPVHLGVVMILNLMVGLLTPPIGMCLFTVAKVAKMPLDRLIKAVVPFYIPIFITLVILVLFPQIVLFLPNLFF